MESTIAHWSHMFCDRMAVEVGTIITAEIVEVPEAHVQYRSVCT